MAVSSPKSKNNTLKDNSNKISINNDVVVTTTTSLENENSTTKNIQIASYSASSEAVSYKASQSRVLTILGIDIVKTSGWVRYTHTDSAIISVDSANFTTVRNLLPGCSTSWSTPDKYIDDDKAVATSDLTFSFTYKGWGPTIGSCEIGVTGDVYEDVDGWLTEY